MIKEPRHYFDKPPTITDRFKRTEAAADAVDGLVLIGLTKSLYFDKSPDADREILSALTHLVKKYPDRRIALIGWLPDPLHRPHSTEYLAEQGVSCGIPEELEDLWDETVRNLKRPSGL